MRSHREKASKNAETGLILELYSGGTLMVASGERRLAAVPANRESPIDMSELCRLGDTATGDSSRNFVHDIIELFLELSPQIYDRTRAAFADGDAHSLARAAHK